MREICKKIYWVARAQFGLDPVRIIYSLRGLPRYVRNLILFRKLYKGRLSLFPCLSDWYEEGGDTKGEYFWQDLYVARQIFLANPLKHVDIGSRMDGFVGHVASYRELEVFDIRPISSSIPGVITKQIDLMKSKDDLAGYCDSLSCLHALEHFGLGRYGDQIDPVGYILGIENMAKMVSQDGVLYLSVPIGKKRVEFNAHRVFDPFELVRLARMNGLLLDKFVWVDAGHRMVESSNPNQDMATLAKLDYALGIFTFVKINKNGTAE